MARWPHAPHLKLTIHKYDSEADQQNGVLLMSYGISRSGHCNPNDKIPTMYIAHCTMATQLVYVVPAAPFTAAGGA